MGRVILCIAILMAGASDGARAQAFSVELQAITEGWTQENGILVTMGVQTELQNTATIYKTRGDVVRALHRFPVIHLVVFPVPPRDYNVYINGRNYPATERSLYAVLGGETEIQVDRVGKKRCSWKDRVVSDVTVRCDLN
jgi:hypothetical protein